MKIFLSSLENSTVRLSKIGPMKYNLISYYYGRNRPERTKAIMANSELIMIDSGAHTFQKGTKLDWVGYTEEYADWIRKHDAKNVVGFFEMDVDNRIGFVYGTPFIVNAVCVAVGELIALMVGVVLYRAIGKRIEKVW